jgi:hypothetical protein
MSYRGTHVAMEGPVWEDPICLSKSQLKNDIDMV